MTARSGASPKTLVDAMQASFEISLRAPEGVTDPVALLWTDADGQWRPLLAPLRNALPHLYMLGAYHPDAREGPVIWLKCVVDRTLPQVSPPPGTIPILYLPDVSRQDLRAGGDCPKYLQPLIELQYRGTMWHQRNGRDWTVEAFLTSDHGLGLDIASDTQTRQAMIRALPLLATEPVDGLRGRRLDADDFDKLVIGDPIRDLLSWLNAPKAFESRCDAGRWKTFREICFREFAFDPEQDGPTAAADALLNGDGKWDEVWQRFRDAPQVYAGLSQLLRQTHPRHLLVEPSRRPDVNEEQEERLRRELGALVSLPQSDACARVIALEEEHKERRGWVWMQLGESPLATALEPLTRLAQLVRTALGGTSPEAIAADYALKGWRCDRAALEALSIAALYAESALVARVVRTLYEPWLDKSARRFQELMTAVGVDPHKLAAGVSAEKDTCILFVDGLRFDVGCILQEQLEARGLHVRLTHRIAPLPTVTATAKPVASPAHAAFTGGPDSADFTPLLSRSQQPVTAARLRDEMARQGVEVIASDEVRLATGAEEGGWAEVGNFDKLGHVLGATVVREMKIEVEVIAERVTGLLSAGWLRIRVVTDHGWLVLPGGLPKIELPPYLVATKWNRCASVRGESTPAVPTYPWYWNEHLRIASPPGIGAFIANAEYAHGGLSLQECVIPEMIVERGEEPARAQIASISWRGMRCHVTVHTTAAGVRVDLRLNWRLAASSIVAAVKDLDRSGEANLVVSDDKHEGAGASIVALDRTGQVLDYKPTTVGEDS